MSVYKKLMEQTLLERPSKAAQRAKAAGLKYASFGRWEDPGTGKVVAKSKGEGDASTLVKVTPSDDTPDKPKKDEPKKKPKKVTKDKDISLAKAAPKPKKVGTPKKDEPVKDVPKNTEPTTDEPKKKEKRKDGFRNDASRQNYKNKQQGIDKDFPGGRNAPNPKDKKLYPKGKKDKAYQTDNAAYETQYANDNTGFENMKDRDTYKNTRTKNGKQQPPMNDKKLYPKGKDDPQYQKDQDEWEGKQKPGASWKRSDGSVAAKDPDGRVQGWDVNDDNPENQYYAKQWAAGEEIDKDKALKQHDIDSQKRVDDFEKWKETSAEDDENEIGGGDNWFAKMFGVKTPSLKDMITKDITS